MKPFAIVVYPKKLVYMGFFQRGEGKTGRVWMARSGEKFEYYERITEEMTTLFFDDEATRADAIEWIKAEYPGRTYMLMNTQEVHYTDFTPYQVGKFTEKGFLPK